MTLRSLLPAVAGILCLASVAQAQQTFDSVKEFLDTANNSPAMKASGANVEITRAVATSGRVTSGGALPDRDEFIDHLDGDPRNWTDPWKAFWVSDDVGSQPNRLRVWFVTQQWYDAYDDVLVADKNHPEIRRGYTMTLRGHVRYNAQRNAWTLYPKGSRFSIDEGLELIGSVDRPLRPFVQSLDYRDDVVSPGDPVRIEGYNFDASTRVLVNGVEIPVTSVSSDGTKLTARMTDAVGHDYFPLKVRKGTTAGGGEVEIGVNQTPRISSASPAALQANGYVVVNGAHLTEVGYVRLSSYMSARGHDNATATLGGRSLRAVHWEPSVAVFKLPADMAAGDHDLVITNPAGDSNAITVTVGGGVGAPNLTASHVTSNGLLVLEGTSIRLSDNDRVKVLIGGAELDPIGSTPVSVLVKLPSGVTQGSAAVRVEGRPESNAIAFGGAASSASASGAAGALGALGN